MGTIDEEIENVQRLAIDRCIAAGGNRDTIEVVEVDVIPVSYVTNAATRILVRVVGDLVEGSERTSDSSSLLTEGTSAEENPILSPPTSIPEEDSTAKKNSSYEVVQQFDHIAYRPRIEGDLWYLSEVDLQYLQDGAGVLGVGSCGESYPAYIACLSVLRSGGNIIIRRQSTLPDEAVVLVAGFMVGCLPLETATLG